MTLLALDPGKVVGWYRSDNQGGTLRLPGIKHLGRSCTAFHTFLTDQFFRKTITTIYIERAFVHAKVANQMLLVHGLISITHMVAHLHDVKVNDAYSAQDWRSWLIKQGRKKKNETEKAFDKKIVTALRTYGITTYSEHEADAAGLLVYAQNKVREGGRSLGTKPTLTA